MSCFNFYIYFIILQFTSFTIFTIQLKTQGTNENTQQIINVYKKKAIKMTLKIYVHKHLKL